MKLTRFVTMLSISILLMHVSSGIPAAAPAVENVMHPVFKPLDDAGRSVHETGRPVNAEKTCGACHDAAYITSHDLHKDKKVTATCIECHFSDGRMTLDAGSFDRSGNLLRNRVLIHEPTAENCGRCHGMVNVSSVPVSIPDGFEAPAPAEQPHRDFLFTQFSGAVFSPQKISGSFLNIASKESLDFAWDAHAEKLLSCNGCHFAPNNPVRTDAKKEMPKHLRADPRRLSVAGYLRAPDHRLITPECNSCHDPLQTHDFLPYKARHLQQLQCMSCHAPSLHGPVLQVVDETVIRPDGGPRHEYRNLERTEGTTLNASLLTGYSPALFPMRNKDGRESVAPRNLVTTWRWVSGTERSPVPAQKVRAAYLEGNGYRADIVEAFDTDLDGRLSIRELRLNTKQKVDIVRTHLEMLGVTHPDIDGVVDARPVSHGTTAAKFLSKECTNCHGGNSRLDTAVALASFAPGGVLPRMKTTPDGVASVPGVIAFVEGGGLSLVRERGPKRLYVLGLTNAGGVDGAGRSVFLLALLSVAVHGGLRIRASRLHRAAHAPLRKVYMYTVYERLWHWFMVFSVLVLLVTGFEIHNAFTLLGMPLAVAVHNAFAVLLAVNAFLSLFYHLASAAIRQFIPPTRNLRNSVLDQVGYYLRGIFQGGPHPQEKTPERKLNPLQQITYLLLLNVLFPLQIVTGILIWGASRWPVFAETIGGLTIITPLHLFLSWLFLSFLVVHLYLTTTGHTVLSNIKAMVDGYDLAEAPASFPKEATHERQTA